MGRYYSKLCAVAHFNFNRSNYFYATDVSR